MLWPTHSHLWRKSNKSLKIGKRLTQECDQNSFSDKWAKRLVKIRNSHLGANWSISKIILYKNRYLLATQLVEILKRFHFSWKFSEIVLQYDFMYFVKWIIRKYLFRFLTHSQLPTSGGRELGNREWVR